MRGHDLLCIAKWTTVQQAGIQKFAAEYVVRLAKYTVPAITVNCLRNFNGLLVTIPKLSGNEGAGLRTHCFHQCRSRSRPGLSRASLQKSSSVSGALDAAKACARACHKSTLELLAASLNQACFIVACSSVSSGGWRVLVSSCRNSSQNFLAGAKDERHSDFTVVSCCVASGIQNHCLETRATWSYGANSTISTT